METNMSNQKMMVMIAALTSCFSAAALAQDLGKIGSATAMLQQHTQKLAVCGNAGTQMNTVSIKSGAAPVSDNVMHTMDHFLGRTKHAPKGLSAQETATAAKIQPIAKLVNDCGKAMQDVAKWTAGADPRQTLSDLLKGVDLVAAEKNAQAKPALIKFMDEQTKFLAAFDGGNGLHAQMDGDANLKKLFGNLHADAIMK